MSIVAALILGDAVVGAGISSRITIIVVAVSTIKLFLNTKALWKYVYMVYYNNPLSSFLVFLAFFNKSYVSIKTWRFRNRRIFIYFFL